MPRQTPTIMYALAVVMLFWFVIGAITLPNATRWFKGKRPSIRQELVVLLAYNGTRASQEWQYDTNVMTTENVPLPPAEGIQGVLYDHGDACSPTAGNGTPPVVVAAPTSTHARVALVRRGGCLFMEKLLNAQRDGASAVIVYDNVSFDQDPIASTGMRIQPSTVSIPAYYVDLAIGMDLQARLPNVTTAAAADNTSFTRVTLFPPQHARLDPWQFALIIIGLVVVTSVAILVSMQCHLWRTGQGCHRLLGRLGGHRSSSAEDHEATVEDLYWRMTVSGSAMPTKIQLSPGAVAALPVRLFDDGEEDKACVICLEPFAKGDTVKTLPCHHEYHKDCIDPWLTKKSVACPLCLQPVHPPPTRPPPAHPPPEDPNEIEMTERQPTSSPDSAVPAAAAPLQQQRQEESVTEYRPFWCDFW